MLQGLIDIANKRISEIRSGEKPALAPDATAKYFREFVVDLDVINEPMIADPDVNNDDVSKRYTHDTIRPVSYYGGTKKVDLGFRWFLHGAQGRFKNRFPNAQEFGKGSRQGGISCSLGGGCSDLQYY